MAPPFAPGHPHPGPLPLSGRGDSSVVGDGFSWRKRFWEDVVVFGCVRRSAKGAGRFETCPYPGPFSNGPYGLPPPVVHDGVYGGMYMKGSGSFGGAAVNARARASALSGDWRPASRICCLDSIWILLVDA